MRKNLKFSETNIVHLFQDTGYQGYKPENTIIIQPTKKPKGKELSEEQKQANKKISSRRVAVEHVISVVKILRMIKDEIRIYKEYTRNIVMKNACAIHNLKIKVTQIVKKC